MCESFDHLFALLEERKGEMTLRINAEQEEKLDYVRSLRRKYTDHLESTAKLLENAIQTMDESEMAVFLQVRVNNSEKIKRGATIQVLDPPETSDASDDPEPKLMRKSGHSDKPENEKRGLKNGIKACNQQYL